MSNERPPPQIRSHTDAEGSTDIAPDNLYLQILESSLVDPQDQDNPEIFQDCLSILHTFLCTIKRTSPEVAVGILNASAGDTDKVFDTGAAEGVLHRLRAVLYNEDGQAISFHRSFADFLLDENRSRQFFCNQERHHHRLLDGCFHLMAEQLRFNIADIPSSYQLDCDNPALSASVETNISRPLRYACRNWSAHLTLTTRTSLEPLGETVNEFLQLRVLFWMEAMSLLGHRGRCQGMLRETQSLFSRIKRFAPFAEVFGTLSDAAAFAMYHSASKAALSTPHLYLSSLATFRQHSAVVQKWRRQFDGIPGFISAQGEATEGPLVAIAVGDQVRALGISPDGCNIAVGSPNGLVRVWGLSTGEELRALEGHTGGVCAVAYSPDGMRIVSGSEDNTVHVWALYSTGEEAMVLQGHTGRVNAVACSPDGNHLVSGSHDKSVRVWDMYTGVEETVLKGHIEHVRAVAYSPDGTRVVSGSDDMSVRLWDLSTGAEAMVLEGHSGGVNAVAYSPDGAHVISGSNDESVIVWDLATGVEVAKLKGHSSWVQAVAYSPDGTHVLSGSTDKSVRIWDVSTGEEARIFKGHTNRVEAVSYSPDGSHVLSGSNDKSVRVWDLSAGEGSRVHEGHIDSIHPVTYSPGSRVVSDSDDSLIPGCTISPDYTPRYIRQQGLDGEFTGWLLSPTDSSTYLMFVPPGALLPDDSNVLALSTFAGPQIDFSNAKLGDRWIECYTPTSV